MGLFSILNVSASGLAAQRTRVEVLAQNIANSETTRTPEGGPRSTHVWYTEPDGELWLEAGTPENAWFRDVQADSALTFRADGRSARYVARVVDDPAGHARIRALIREKYGFRDRWVGLIVDTSRSVAVRLVPQEG